MNRRLLVTAACAAILTMGVSAFAQPPGGGRQGGGGRGMGMFGGAPSRLTLVSNEAVQKDLALTSAQTEQLSALKVDEALRASRPGPGGQNFQQMSEEERSAAIAKMQAAAKEVEAKFLPKVEEILDETQRTRLKEISYQAAGPEIYTNTDVVAALKLTDEQKEKIATAKKDLDTKRRELFASAGPGGGGGDIREKMQELTASFNKSAEETLTDEQKTELTKLKGKEFDVAQLRRGPGGPGGRPGGGGGRPGGGNRQGGRPGAEGRPGNAPDAEKK
jgi:hypothetical protein